MKKLKYICICTPTLGSVSIEWTAMLKDLLWPMNTCYMNVFVKDDIGGEIAEARNKIVAQAMSYENEHREVTKLFWLDDDVLPSRTALLALNNHDKDIVSGVYFTRCDVSEPLIFPGRGQGTLPFIPDKIYGTGKRYSKDESEILGHGMGLCLIKMDVYKEMQKEIDLDKYGNPQWYKTTTVSDATVEHNTLFLGGTEDLYFLNKANEMGFRPVVDCSRHTFGFHYDMKAQIGFPKDKWEERKTGKITWKVDNKVIEWN